MKKYFDMIIIFVVVSILAGGIAYSSSQSSLEKQIGAYKISSEQDEPQPEPAPNPNPNPKPMMKQE